jgi:hypothetical protein
MERREHRRLAAQTKHLLIEKGFSTIAALGRSGALVLCAYFLYLSAGVLAGKHTDLTAVVKAIVDVGVNQWGAWALSALFGVAWYNERRVRRKTIKETAPYIRELEERIDPNRQSSGLLPDGRPKKEDRDD